MKWCGGIALNLLISSAVWGATETPPPDAATLYNTTIAPYAGSRESVQNNLVTPLMKDGQLSTVDKTKTFTVNTLQPSGTPVLRVTAFLSPGTGDLSKVTVEQNLSNGNAMDTASVYPYDASGRMISGVCANGYIQCDPGTYNNCQFRQWTVDPTGAIGAKVAGAAGPSDLTGSMSALSSCYCFNQGCAKYSNSAVLNLDPIVSDLGGGIVATFLSVRSDLSITNVADSGTGTISYYAVKASGVTTGLNTTSSSMPTLPGSDVPGIQATFDSNPTYLDATAVTAQQQQTNGNTLFNIVSNATSGQARNTVTCQKQRIIALYNRSMYCEETLPDSSTTTSGGTTTTTNWNILSTSPPTNYGLKVYTGTFRNSNDCSCSNVSGYCSPLSAVSPAPVSVLDVPASYVTGLGSYAHFDGTSAGNFRDRSKKGGWDDCTYDNSDYYYYCQKETEYDSEVVSDSCGTLENMAANGQCILTTEMADGRPVVVSATPTGFAMADVCKTFGGSFRTYNLCRAWWQKTYTYSCEATPAQYDFSNIKSRIKGIQDSASMSGNATMTYSDGGNSFTYSVFPKGDLPGCSQVCKTKMPFAATLSTATDVKAGLQTSATTTGSEWKFFYKSCTETPPGIFTCPVNSALGEVLVSDCKCSGDFGDAVSALDAVNNASQDMICAPF